MAGVADCPVEPAQNVPVASGDVFAGTNCTLNATGEVDSFVFKAKSGDIWHLLAASNGVARYGIGMCLALYDPNLAQVYGGCTNTVRALFSIMTDQQLTTTGTYTIVVSEEETGPLNYGLSLERDYPTPPDGQKVALGKLVAGVLSPGEDSPAFTFKGVTTGIYQVSATLPTASHPRTTCA